jgi:hypothetical protein
MCHGNEAFVCHRLADTMGNSVLGTALTIQIAPPAIHLSARSLARKIWLAFNGSVPSTR